MSETQIKKENGEFQKDGVSVPEIILAIETGITGGSLSLFRRGVEIDCWVGEQNISRAEDVLDEISKILKRNDVAPKNIGLTAFSKGPGSSTGLRIGAALALGLKKSLGCEICAYSLLSALVDGEAAQGKLIAAVSYGSRQVCWQYFNGRQEDSARINETSAKIFVSETDSLKADWQNFDFDKLMLHEKLYTDLYINEDSRFTEGRFKEISVVSAGKNMARLIAAKVLDGAGAKYTNDLDLIYPDTF